MIMSKIDETNFKLLEETIDSGKLLQEILYKELLNNINKKNIKITNPKLFQNEYDEINKRYIAMNQIYPYLNSINMLTKEILEKKELDKRKQDMENLPYTN